MAAAVLSGNLPAGLADPTASTEPWHQNLNVRLMCKDCREDPPDIVEDHSSGDLICGSCGLVLQQRTIDQSSEWRTFSNDDAGNDDPSRVGDVTNSLLNGDQLGTGIAFGDRQGRDLSRMQAKAQHDKGNKALLQAYKQIGALCDGWQLPSAVSDTAKHLYKDADESRLFRGKSQDALIAGCIFLACRRNQVPRSFREVTSLTRVSKKEIGRIFKALKDYLLKKDKHESRIGAGGVVMAGEQYQPTETAEASELCTRYCSILDMDQRATNIAIILATRTSATGILAGRSPLSAAAACIFAASHLMGQPKNARDIVSVAGVSDSTIRQAYRKLYENLESLVTEELRTKGADPSKLPKPA